MLKESKGLFVCLPVYLYSFLFVCLFVQLFVCLSVYISFCLSIRLSFCLSVCLNIHSSNCISVHPSVCQFNRLSIYLSVYLPLCLPLCLQACFALYLDQLSVRSVTFWNHHIHSTTPELPSKALQHRIHHNGHLPRSNRWARVDWRDKDLAKTIALKSCV